MTPVELFCRKCGREGFYARYSSYPVCDNCENKK